MVFKIIMLFFIFSGVYAHLFFCLVSSTKTRSWRLCFHDNSAGERGTQQSIYDYATYAEKLLNISSVIIFPKSVEEDYRKDPNTSSLLKFKAAFPVHTYSSSDGRAGGPNLSKLALEVGCRILYILKSGEKAGRPSYQSSYPKNGLIYVTHAVFSWQPHGDAYAAITEYFGDKKNPEFVPHIVTAPSPSFSLSGNSYNGVSMRDELRIPKSALVLCRHGGYGTFNIDFAHEVVKESTTIFGPGELHYVFMGTAPLRGKNTKLQSGRFPFAYSRQIHHVDASTNMRRKEDFFSSCDAMIHARSDGETFGLAVAEFYIRRKAVITYALSPERTHVRILDKEGLYYQDKKGLHAIIKDLVRNGVPKNFTYRNYDPYLPENVMKKFYRVFIKPFIDSVDISDLTQVVGHDRRGSRSKNSSFDRLDFKGRLRAGSRQRSERSKNGKMYKMV